MNNKLDKILLATLWLTASTLVTCFWFNIRFGFNIFSGAHWRHLAYMQATQTPVSGAFYISIIASVVITMFGLYMLIRPRFRKITLPARDIKKTAPTPQPTPTKKPAAAATPTQPTPQPAPGPAPAIPEINLARPPRLNMGTPAPETAQTFTAPPPGATISPTAPVAPIAPAAQQMPAENPELREIFESTGYTIKPTPHISTPISLLAIGANETVWIGGTGITTDALKTLIDKMQQIFSDTLDDIEITVNGFIISAPDADTPSAPEILTFDSTDSLRNYMEQHSNPPLDPDDAENFDAFSSYMSTVVEYLGKI